MRSEQRRGKMERERERGGKEHLVLRREWKGKDRRVINGRYTKKEDYDTGLIMIHQ